MTAFQLERLTLAGMGIGHAAECLPPPPPTPATAMCSASR